MADLIALQIEQLEAQKVLATTQYKLRMAQLDRQIEVLRQTVGANLPI